MTCLKIFDGWNYVTDLSGSNLGAQVGNKYVNTVNATIEDLIKQLNSHEGVLTDTSKLKGFVAEYWHAGTFNIEAALRDSNHRASVEGSVGHASVDVSTNFDHVYSMKYYATGKASALSQAKDVFQAYYEYLGKSRVEKPMTFEQYLAKNNYSADTAELLQSVYHGQGRIIPKEQLDEAIKFLQQKISSESMKEGINRAAVLAKYEETLTKLSDRIRDGRGVESIPLTNKEAEAIAALCKEGKFKPEDFGLSLESLISTDYILQQALKSGCTAALLTVIFQIAPDIYNAFMCLVKSGEIDVELLKETGLKAIPATAEGFLRGSIASAIILAARAGKLGPTLENIDAGVVGAITFLVLDTIKNSILVAMGKMTPKELEVILTKEIIISVASLSGGMAVQWIMPELPVLGYMLGSLAGSLIASVVIFASEKMLLVLCVDTGFSCFGLVEQSYELPPESLEKLGYVITELENIEYDTIKYNTIKYDSISYDVLKNQEGFEFKLLRRGVIDFYKVGYI